MKMQLIARNLRSKSLKEVARSLSIALGYKVWRTNKPNPKRKQVRYGDVVDKLSQYKWFTSNGIPCPEYTDDMEQAKEWIEEGHTVFCRTLTRASEGRGIVVATEVDHLVYAPVYTKYTKKKREFRVHIFKQNVVAITEKRKKQEWNDGRDTKIRNLANGYVFCHSIPNGLPSGLQALALDSARMVSSDFCGVDLIFNEHQQQLYVIEVNSAPGISGSNIDSYVQHILGEVA
jgi:glutathione synthase/RimK-type ligase-like ATP-grasp enzyme